MPISIKVKFRSSSGAAHEGSLYYQITHNRKTRQLITDYRLLPAEWDEDSSSVISCGDDDRRSALRVIRRNIDTDLERITRIARRFDTADREYTVSDIIDEFRRYAKDYTLFRYMEAHISRLQNDGKIRTSETYQCTLNSFKKFRQNRDLLLDSITPEIMEAYEAWQHKRGIVPNTISFYTRILRAVYNRAVEDDIIKDRNPFRRVYTGVDKTVKRALPLRAIKKIKRLDLAAAPNLDYARDMFMMSFYLRGMSFVDMAFLKKSDLQNGSVVYRRRKTGQLLVIAWTDEMQTIIDKYPPNASPYLLPIIRESGIDERAVYRNMNFKINGYLKKVAKLAHIDMPLTLYVARHSWASAAKSKGIPMSVISEGMGHDSEHTTRIYLASLDTTTVNRANSLILKSLR